MATVGTSNRAKGLEALPDYGDDNVLSELGIESWHHSPHDGGCDRARYWARSYGRIITDAYNVLDQLCPSRNFTLAVNDNAPIRVDRSEDRSAREFYSLIADGERDLIEASPRFIADSLRLGGELIRLKRAGLLGYEDGFTRKWVVANPVASGLIPVTYTMYTDGMAGLPAPEALPAEVDSLVAATHAMYRAD